MLRPSALLLATLLAAAVAAGQNETRPAPQKIDDPGIESTAAHTSWNSRLVREADGTITAAFFNRASETVVPGSRTAVGFSADGGATFSTVALSVPVPEFTGVQDLAYSQRDGQTILLGASTGTQPRQVMLYFSEGADPVNVAAALPPTSILEDSVMAVVNNPASMLHGRVYVTGFDFSTQQGVLLASDTPTGDFAFVSTYTTPAGDARLAGIGIDTNGDVLLAALGTQSDIYFMRSTDGGVTLSAPVALGAAVPLSNDGALTTVGFLATGRPRIVANPVTGTLYVVYAGRGQEAGDNSDCYIQASPDGGATWSIPFQLSELGQRRAQWAPDIAFNGAGQAIVTWNDADWGPRANTFRRVAFLLRETTQGAINYGYPFTLTPHDSPIVWDSELDITGPGYAANAISDREGQVAVPGGFLCTFAQTHERAPGVERQYQADVYSVFVPENGFGPQVQAVSLDVEGAPSRLAAEGCFGLRPLLMNPGESSVDVTYTAEIISGPPGLTLSTATGSVSLPVYTTARYGSPLVLQTQSVLDCSTAEPPVIRLTMTTSQGAVFSDDLTVPLWGAEDAVLSSFTVEGPIAIPDSADGVAHGSVEVPIEVSGLGDLNPIGNVSLALTLPHTFVSDLKVELIDNNGNTWLLANRNGVPNRAFGEDCPADRQNSTVFLSDPELTPLERGRPPFVGYWQPVGDLSDLAGRLGNSYNGTWRLRVSDHAGLDVGAIQCAALQFHSRGCDASGSFPPDCRPSLEFVDTVGIQGSQPFGSDSALGPGECHALRLRLTNRSFQTLTNLRGRVVAAPSANITTGGETVRFPDISPGASAESISGFMLQVSSNLGTCPSVNEFTFFGESDQGPVEVIGRVLVSGALGGGGAVNNSAAVIPTDGTPLEIPFTVNFMTEPVATVELETFIEHTAVGELELTIVDPLGTEVRVFEPSSDTRDNLGTSAAKFVLFRDRSTLEITDPRENAPFVGAYKPAQPLSAFAGTTAAFANGTWKLRIRDTGGPGAGTFRSAALFVLDGLCDTDPSPSCENSVEIFSVVVEPGEDDALLEPGECTRLRIGLRNNGVLPQTNPTLEFQSTDVVSDPRDVVEFPTIAPGATVWADETIAFQTFPDSACGDSLSLPFGYESDQNSISFGTAVPFGYGSGPIGTFAGSSSPLAIPDSPAAAVASAVTVGPFGGKIANMQVRVHVTHSFVGDLELTLISPTGIRSRLVSRYGGPRDGFGTGGCFSTGQELIFRMDATQLLPPLASGSAPVTGEGTGLDGLFRYVGLSGADVSGTWLLEARDFAADDTGTIQCWGIGIGNASCNGSGPPCPTPFERDHWAIH